MQAITLIREHFTNYEIKHLYINILLDMNFVV